MKKIFSIAVLSFNEKVVEFCSSFQKEKEGGSNGILQGFDSRN